ncbi:MULTISPECIES: iron ABC transporter permease [unclassified Oceanobacter]|jgi:iron complex transport system permease protein|uniref:FecCD family ABC transporter permease n=1 Tax=unclassified Oceanobacter TaxID=2620260 RepID=UPI0027355F05|nr:MULTISPECIES: iron ABC transporter permease [unclassified Oceanobacter]MDP2546665.1 iron ABC transporter permease [Oceanobacter sp. 4_MG-2023]MDP2608595.1 iron ABC transporter permease [Oceanobacter sp. 1_MG-2023]MDP2611643.1 iron ABC transporter permease [Oceanobacter sp. 2_MG-2023]
MMRALLFSRRLSDVVYGWRESIVAQGATGQRLVLLLMAVVLVLVFLLGLTIGPVSVAVNDVWSSLQRAITFAPIGSANDWVVRELRLPRALLAMIVGAGLAVAGVITQGVFRNPLADPGLIGVSSGAALAAVAVIVLNETLLSGWVSLTGPLALPLAAFMGGLGVTLVIYRLGTRGGQTQVGMLLLAGVAINVLAGAATGVLTYAADDQQLRDMTFWSMGSLASGRWQDVAALTGLIGVPLLLSLRYRRVLNALLMGEQVAIHLGFDVQRSKRWLLAFAALMVGAGVAVAGIIGFVGLVVPHLLRMVMGSDHRGLIPAAAMGGALLLLLADSLARTWMAPADLPVGLVMALLGGPVFLLLLMQQNGGQSR